MRILMISLLLMMGCRSQPEEKEDMPDNPSILMYLTWRGYPYEGDRKDAEFILNGTPVGKGEQGFRNAIKAIPMGSTVVVYPDYILITHEEEPSGEMWQPPYDPEKLAAWGKANPDIKIIRSIEKQFQKKAYLLLKNGEWILVSPQSPPGSEVD